MRGGVKKNDSLEFKSCPHPNPLPEGEGTKTKLLFSVTSVVKIFFSSFPVFPVVKKVLLFFTMRCMAFTGMRQIKCQPNQGYTAG